MCGLFDYLDWRGDLTFEMAPICEVDALLFSILAYIEFAGIVLPARRGRYPKVSLKDAADIYFNRHSVTERLGKLIPKETLQLFQKMANSKRFSNIKLSGYIAEVSESVEKQFSAISIHLPDGVFLAFRGTDDSLVGWKEDFALSLNTPIPSQQQALRYLIEMADVISGKLYLGGHSKGGNLAVYASVFAPKNIQNRISRVYNNDGPGFGKHIIDSYEYLRMRDKIETYVPQSSVIGMLLEHEEVYEIVKSNRKLVMQHDPFSWEVLGYHFVLVKERSRSSVLIDHTVKQTILQMNEEQKQYFIEGLFQIISMDEFSTLSEVHVGSLTKLVKHYREMDEATKQALVKTIKSFAFYVTKQFVNVNHIKK